jgi:hypothetical protein
LKAQLNARSTDLKLTWNRSGGGNQILRFRLRQHPKRCVIVFQRSPRLLDSADAYASGVGLRLQRGAVLKTDGSLKNVLALGRILEAGHELSLFEEEVPREGVRVTRSYQ